MIACTVMGDAQVQTPQFLLIVRERLRAGMEDPYNRNELEVADTCATLGCPHPYLALATVAGPTEVWWFNAFASEEERDQLDAAYARNEALMAKLLPLGKRKETFRETLTTTHTTYRPDLSGDNVLRLAAARFFVITVTPHAPTPSGVVFESAEGERFVIASTGNRATADAIAARAGSRSTILAVQPQWSFPAEDWVTADPEFWSSSRVGRRPRALRQL